MSPGHQVHHRLAASAIVFLLLAAVPSSPQVAPAGPATCADPVSGSGKATYYNYTPGSGACDFAGDDSDAMVAAMNPIDYAGSAMCGRWLRVTGPRGSVTVRVVDVGPGIPAGGLDLSKPAFARIGNPRRGRVSVTWETVASPVADSVTVYVKPGSNAWWVGLQPRHHRYGIASLEYLGPSGYVAAPRAGYNYFIVDGSLGVPVPLANPFTVRLTDVNGQQLVVTGLAPREGREFASGRQFPICAEFLSPVRPPSARLGLMLLAPVPEAADPRTTLAFYLSAPAPVTLRVYDYSGRKVAVLMEGVPMEAGHHAAAWDGRDAAGRAAAGGRYLMRLESAGRVQAWKTILLP